MIELWREGKMCDVEVKAGALGVPAHSLVLASASVFFRTFFTSSVGASKGTVDSGVNPALLPQLLEYVYTGKCSIDETMLVDVLESAERLGMPALVGSATQAIEQRLSLDSCVGAWTLSIRFNIASLREAAYRVTRKCFAQLGTESLAALSPEQLTRLLQDDKLPVEEEVEVFEAVTRWHGLQSPPPSVDTTVALLAHIRFKRMLAAHVLDRVKTSVLMEDRRAVDVLVEALLEGSTSPRGQEIPRGVQLNLPDSCLDGWTCHLDVAYFASTPVEALNIPASASHVFIGARDGNGQICIGAFGERAAVLQTTTSKTEAVAHNGAFWYRVEGSSFGFSRVRNIFLIGVDVLGSGTLSRPVDEDGKYRLSWQLRRGLLELPGLPGVHPVLVDEDRVYAWRAGQLNASNDRSTLTSFRKLVYYK